MGKRYRRKRRVRRRSSRKKTIRISLASLFGKRRGGRRRRTRRRRMSLYWVDKELNYNINSNFYLLLFYFIFILPLFSFVTNSSKECSVLNQKYKYISYNIQHILVIEFGWVHHRRWDKFQLNWSATGRVREVCRDAPGQSRSRKLLEEQNSMSQWELIESLIQVWKSSE